MVSRATCSLTLVRLMDVPGFALSVGGAATPGPFGLLMPGPSWQRPGVLAASPINVRPPRYRHGMRYLMLMWADADATSGGEADFQAWAEFDAQVKAAGAFVLNGALAPASTDAHLVQTAIAGHAIESAVERRPFAEGTRQIQAFYIMDLPGMDAALQWANRLPTYGSVEVRELLQF